MPLSAFDLDLYRGYYQTIDLDAHVKAEIVAKPELVQISIA
ncbi:hypothetical protein [Acidicapsa acidisoli]|nr:hypothetical protein [Acidicapsa acidisoli]